MNTDIISEINACISRMKIAGEQPDTIITTTRQMGFRRVFGTSRQKKQIRFLNRKRSAYLEGIGIHWRLLKRAP